MTALQNSHKQGGYRKEMDTDGEYMELYFLHQFVLTMLSLRFDFSLVPLQGSGVHSPPGFPGHYRLQQQQ